jgi:hypothetical protein
VSIRNTATRTSTIWSGTAPATVPINLGISPSSSASRRRGHGPRPPSRLASGRRPATLPATRPIVAAVHLRPSRHIREPGRTGSVSAERPAQGSVYPCAILMGRAVLARPSEDQSARSTRPQLPRSRRLGCN